MNSYVYPKVKHTRTESPPVWKGYRRYKSALQREFKRTCVYCRRPDKFLEVAFGVDHYRPKKKFPALATTYSNLFYSCNPCNSHKGEFWSSDVELENGFFIPNPCDHVMFDHLRHRDSTVVPRTNAGQCVVDILDLNNETEIEYRKNILLTIKGLIDLRKKVAETLREIEKRLLDAGPSQEKTLRQYQERHQKEFDSTEKLLRELGANI